MQKTKTVAHKKPISFFFHNQTNPPNRPESTVAIEHGPAVNPPMEYLYTPPIKPVTSPTTNASQVCDTLGAGVAIRTLISVCVGACAVLQGYVFMTCFHGFESHRARQGLCPSLFQFPLPSPCTVGGCVSLSDGLDWYECPEGICYRHASPERINGGSSQPDCTAEP